MAIPGGQGRHPRSRGYTEVLLLIFGLLLGGFVRELVEEFKHLVQQQYWRASTTVPQRLRVHGKEIYYKQSPIVLRGFDLMFKYGADGMGKVTRQDRLLKDLVPGVNFVRLIINHWWDDVTMSVGTDCYDATTVGHLRVACLAMFDEVVHWATEELGCWAVITARSALGAGDGADNATIFDNATLRSHWVEMWASLAKRYASQDRIAGFEVMSEPRSYAPSDVIHAAQQEACSAIWREDRHAICVVGPARFYDRFRLEPTYLITGGPVLYAANFFAPRSWVSAHISVTVPNASYPGYFPCCDVYQKDRERRRAICGGVDAFACATAPLVRVDRSWLEDQLRAVLRFREVHSVPIWIDQWGVRADAVGGLAAHDAYLADILDVLAWEKLHWTYWIWRRTSSPPDWTCDGFAVACQSAHGSYFLNDQLLEKLSNALAWVPSPSIPMQPRLNSSRFTSTVLYMRDATKPRIVRVEVGATPQHRISPDLNAMFYEEINFGGEGGLFAELVRNRDFEALGRGCIIDCPTLPPWQRPPFVAADGRDAHEPPAASDDFRPWTAVGGAKLRIDDETAPFASNPHSLRVECTRESSCGVSNPGYWGIAVLRASAEFRLVLYARTGGSPARLMARLRREDGQIIAHADVQAASSPSTAAAAGGTVAQGWVEYQATLTASAAAINATLEVVRVRDRQDDSGVFWLDAVSLFPSNAVAGLFRRDIFDQLKALQPGFVRLPGGNFLEGFGPRTRWDWKTTLGHWAARPGHYNAAWGYWVTDGIGLFEMMTLCELLGAPCQLSVYTGYSMHAEYVPLVKSERFAQDALDLLEFANGVGADAGANWSAMRRAMGREEPFGLNRLEVGNEERELAPDGYAAHYQLISQRLWSRWPDLVIIASGRWLGPEVEGSPCMSPGMRCDIWDEHFYQTPDEMAAMSRHYDDYNRSWPAVFVGEYAANKPDGAPTLRAAIAEAIFALGFERNADVVVASAFAPLLNNVHGTQWPHNLINFDASRVYGLPSYHVQRMLSDAMGSYTLATALDGASVDKEQGAVIEWSASASLAQQTELSEGSIVLKLANYGGQVLHANVSFASWTPRLAVATAGTVLTAASPDAENTLDEPDLVIPTDLSPLPTVVGTGLMVELPPWSLLVVRVEMEMI